MKIAEAKYPQAEGWRIVWILITAAAIPEGALDASKMNVNPGGRERVMRDGWWNGKPQKMNYSLGVPKGMHVVLEERGVNTHGMVADKMRELIRGHPDFKNKKSTIERCLVEEHEVTS